MAHRAWVCSVIGVLLTCGGLSARQAERTDTDQLSQRATARLKTLHDEAQQLAAQERSLLGELRKLELDRKIKLEELRQAESRAARVAEELADLDRQIVTLDAQARADIPVLRERLVSLYKLGGGRYLRLLLSATDVSRIGQAARLVSELADQDRRRVADHQRRLDELNGSRQTVAERQSRLVSLKKQVERARFEIDRALVTRAALVREIDQRRDLNAELSGELLTAQQKLLSAVTDLPSNSASL